jgi:hypothetical protein
MKRPEAQGEPQILTRLYVTDEGNLIVTDLWEEVEQALEAFFVTEEGTDK